MTFHDFHCFHQIWSTLISVILLLFLPLPIDSRLSTWQTESFWQYKSECTPPLYETLQWLPLHPETQAKSFSWLTGHMLAYCCLFDLIFHHSSVCSPPFCLNGVTVNLVMCRYPGALALAVLCVECSSSRYLVAISLLLSSVYSNPTISVISLRNLFNTATHPDFSTFIS